MRFIFPAALLLAYPSTAALADNNPTFDPGHDLRVSIYQPVCASKAGATRTFPTHASPRAPALRRSARTLAAKRALATLLHKGIRAGVRAPRPERADFPKPVRG